ncbi:hypothetical protein LCGC14_1539530 [marine sediment metagenome]|uniref:Uncharacterized protein n=1 Tax=marine sediment metagenome TaxID=412755 RepID=A0A0F9JEE2_9ZZZZ
MGVGIKGSFGRNRDRFLEYAVAAVLGMHTKVRKYNVQIVTCKLCGLVVESGKATAYRIRNFAGPYRSECYLCNNCHEWAQVMAINWDNFRKQKQKKPTKES